MVEILGISPLEESQFIKPKRVHFVTNGRKRAWDLVESHDSVAILLYNEDENAFVFVKQFRPAIYLRNHDGFTVELCAGIVDKDKSLEQIAIEEVDEETGYKVELCELERITSFYTSVGIAGAKQTLYYAKVNNEKRKHQGGGVELEEIEVAHVDVKKAKEFMMDESVPKTSGLIFALMWWFSTK